MKSWSKPGLLVCGVVAGLAAHGLHFGVGALAQSASGTTSQPAGGKAKSGSKTLPPEQDADPDAPPVPVLPAFRHNDNIHPQGSPVPKTLAQVGYGVIGYPHYDEAYANDRRRIIGQVANIPSGSVVDWRVEFNIHHEASAVPINAPGNLDDGTYRALSKASTELKFRIINAQGGALNPARELSANKQCEALREQNASDPHEPVESHTDVNSYGGPLLLVLESHSDRAVLNLIVRASVFLQSLREGVSVGGSAKVEVVSGKMSAFRNDAKMKKADGTSDADWPIQ